MRPTYDGVTGVGVEAPLRSGTLLASLPIGRDGLNLALGATRTATHPGGSVAQAGLDGDLEVVSLNISYPLLLRRGFTLRGRGTFEHIDETLESVTAGVATPVTHDRLSVVRASLQANGCEPPVCFASLAEFSRGIDILGARRAGDIDAAEPLSRQSADAVFSHARASFALSTAIDDDYELSLQASGQGSFSGALLTPEQIGITGPSTLSGFSSGSLSGDHGWYLRSEAAAPQIVDGIPLAPYVYGAHGAVYLHRPSSAERSSTFASSAGLGLRFRLGDPDGGGANLEGRVEFGKIWSEDDAGTGGHRGLFLLTTRF